MTIIAGVLGVSTIIATVSVILLHWHVYNSPARNTSGIIPLHVILVATAHLCLLFSAGIGIVFPLATWTLMIEQILFIMGTVLTLIALFIVGDLQRRNL